MKNPTLVLLIALGTLATIRTLAHTPTVHPHAAIEVTPLQDGDTGENDLDGSRAPDKSVKMS